MTTRGSAPNGALVARPVIRVRFAAVLRGTIGDRVPAPSRVTRTDGS